MRGKATRSEMQEACDVGRKEKKTAKRKVKLPIRLDAKPSRPHSTKKGKRGYNRRRAKLLIRQEMEGDEPRR